MIALVFFSLFVIIVGQKDAPVTIYTESQPKDGICSIQPIIKQLEGSGEEYVFGAEVFVDPQADVSLLSKDTLTSLLQQFKVLVFRGLGNRLSMQNHVNFAKNFGPVRMRLTQPPPYIFRGVHVSVASSTVGKDHSLQAPVVLERESQIKNGEPQEVFKIVVKPNSTRAFGEGWHTDLTYEENPPKAAVLIARRVPPYGLGNTLFLDAIQMYKKLPQELKDFLEDKYAIHSDRAGHVTLHKVVQELRGNNATDKVLFLNRHFVSHLIEEKDAKTWKPSKNNDIITSTANTRLHSRLLETLDYIDNFGDEESIKISWNAGDVAVWDEMTTMHAGHYDYQGYGRELHRVLVAHE